MFKPSKPQHIATKAYADPMLFPVKSDSEGYPIEFDGKLIDFIRKNHPLVINVDFRGCPFDLNRILYLRRYGTQEGVYVVEYGSEKSSQDLVIAEQNGKTGFVALYQMDFVYDEETGKWKQKDGTEETPGTGGDGR